MAEFVLQVHDIDEGGKDYAFPLEPQWLTQALSDTPLAHDPAGGPGHLSLHAQKNGRHILLTGRLQAPLLVECCRCLQPAALPVDTEVTTLLSPADDARLPGQLQPDRDDLERGTFSGQELVLDALVRELLVVECPMQPLCDDACQGIEIPERVRPPRDVFGQGSGAIDPRLVPLLALKNKIANVKE